MQFHLLSHMQLYLWTITMFANFYTENIFRKNKGSIKQYDLDGYLISQETNTNPSHDKWDL
jgi:hypothetical protein